MCSHRRSAGGTLAPVDLLAVRSTLLRSHRIRQILLANASRFPALAEWGEPLQDLEHVAAEIGRAISDRSEVMDSASPRLAHLRAEVRVLQDRLLDRIQRIAQNPDNAAYLQEAIVTQRQGRYVVPVRTEFKGRLPGIVHDQSGSGATLFVEPLAIVELNNDWRQRQMEEQEEVNRILRELTELVADEAPYIHTTLEMLTGLDLILARAHFADDLHANQPELLGFQHSADFKPEQHPGVIVELRQARHPLLNPATVVPIDFHFGDDFFIVVITGPNTGGKTVSLKTVGLLTLMAQAGMAHPQQAWLPAHAVRGHLRRHRRRAEHRAEPEHLFLAHDQHHRRPARGRRPTAWSCWTSWAPAPTPKRDRPWRAPSSSHFRDSGMPTVGTTHYSEVKLFAHATAGIVNASVEFDLETLGPTYELTIGLPGRSNALAIARRLGLPRTIVDSAESLVQPESLAADTLLAEIREARDATRRAQQKAEALERMAAAAKQSCERNWRRSKKPAGPC